MLKIQNTFYTEKYYAKDISLLDILRPTRFIQFQGKSYLQRFMNKTPYYTKYVDLSQSEVSLKASFSKSVKYSINKSNKSDITFHTYSLKTQNDIDFYVNYFNDFSKSKNLYFTLSSKDITSFLELDSFMVTCAKYNEHILVMHGYTLNKESKSVILKHSSSHYRVQAKEQIDRNLIGIANRFLHYEDMLYFKKENFSIYDLGGYQIEETKDSSLLQINSFKDGFRGELIQQNHYESYTFSILKSGYKLIQAFHKK